MSTFRSKHAHTVFTLFSHTHKMPRSPLTSEVHAMNHRLTPARVAAATVVASIMTVGAAKVAETIVVAAEW